MVTFTHCLLVPFCTLQALLETGTVAAFGALFSPQQPPALAAGRRPDLLAAALSAAAVLMHADVPATAALLQSGVAAVAADALSPRGAPEVLQAALAASTYVRLPRKPCKPCHVSLCKADALPWAENPARHKVFAAMGRGYIRLVHHGKALAPDAVCSLHARNAAFNVVFKGHLSV